MKTLKRFIIGFLVLPLFTITVFGVLTGLVWIDTHYGASITCICFSFICSAGIGLLCAYGLEV